MEIIANQVAWKQALDTLSPIRTHGGSAGLPILNCALLQALDTGLTLTRSDRERQLRAPLLATEVDGQGELAVDARKLGSIIAALPTAAVVRARHTGERLTLTASVGARTVSRFTLGTLPGSDYPLMDLDPARDGDGPAAGTADPATAGKSGAPLSRLTLPGKRLAAVINATSFAMAKQDVRYYMNGMLLEWRGETLLLVATDGHRLADVGLRAAVDGEAGQAIVPADTVTILAKIGAETGDADLTLEMRQNRMAVAWQGGDLVSKLIDGRFPEWRRVVPRRQHEAQWRLPVAETTAALGRVKILSHEQFHGVALEVREDEPETLYLSAANTQRDEAEEALPLTEPSAPGRWGFQIDYLLDVLGHCPAPELEFKLGDAASSALLGPGTTSGDEAQDDPEWVVMPMLL